MSQKDKYPNSNSLNVQKALGGKITGVELLQAHIERNNGEHRPEQEVMAKAIHDAIIDKENLLAQAGTGTGKSLAYLFPLAASGCRSVIATATNQLSEQLMRFDLPKVQESLASVKIPFTYALLKGRNNYACKAKISEIKSFNEGASDYEQGDTLFDVEEAETQTVSALKRKQAREDAVKVGELISWAERTQTGDRSEAPAVIDRVWGQVSTSASDCPGAASCPFGDVCFTEQARNIAKKANVVVTNHALLAQDVKSSLESGKSDSSQNSVFGKYDITVVDEAHDLEDSLTSALSSDIDIKNLDKFVAKTVKYVLETADKDNTDLVMKIRKDLEDFSDSLDDLPDGILEELPKDFLDLLNALVTRFIMLQNVLKKAASDALKEDKHKKASAIGVLESQTEDWAGKLVEAKTVGTGRIRWVERKNEDKNPVLKTAPLEIGEYLQKYLENKTLIATSATLTLGNSFDSVVNDFGFDKNKVKTLDVGSPFDYPKQGMLYIPTRPFPEPVGKDRTAHTEAVLEEVLELVTSAGGRTLALFTTTMGARKAAEYLREHLPHLNVHAHGDAPADVLVQQFTEEETSVLCATMGMWQGTNVEGPSCSLVIIDKVAFAPIDDTLTVARKANVDAKGRDGFTEVILSKAAVSLAQGAGRLIRNKTDKGVVAILDPRILTKNYGKTLIASLPDFKIFNDRKTVTDALIRLTGGTTEAHRKATPQQKSYNKAGYSAKPASKVPKKASYTKNLRPRKID